MENNKSLLIRMPKELHRQMKIISAKTDCSLNKYVIKAFEEIIKSENIGGEKNEQNVR